MEFGSSLKRDFAIYYDILIQLCGERPADSVVGMDRIECLHNQSCSSRDSSGERVCSRMADYDCNQEK